MAKQIDERDLQGFRCVKPVLKLLAHVHDTATERDRAGNRRWHMDEHLALLLLFMFNPICDSLRALQRASQLKKVQRLLGVPRASLGSLSDANRVFDADLLRGLIGELAEQLKPLPHDSTAICTQQCACQTRRPRRLRPGAATILFIFLEWAEESAGNGRVCAAERLSHRLNRFVVAVIC